MPRKEFLRIEKDIKRGSERRPSAPSQRIIENLPGIDVHATYRSPLSSNLIQSSPSNRSGSGSVAGSTRPRMAGYNSKRRGRVSAVDEHVSSQLFAVDNTSKILFSCGHWDHSFKGTSIETGRLIQSVTAHKDAVTCLALATELGKTWLITGSRDCTLMVWDVVPFRDLPICEYPLFTLYGHDDAVTSVAVSSILDAVISGSVDGTVIVHSLREGSYIRTILVGGAPNTRNLSAVPPNADFSAGQGPVTTRRRIHWVGITKEAYVVVYLVDEMTLCTYTINGRLLATKDVRERLYAILPSEDGQVLITGGENCLVVLRWVIFYLLYNIYFYISHI
jgi:WD40 repeat protein